MFIVWPKLEMAEMILRNIFLIARQTLKGTIMQKSLL